MNSSTHARPWRRPFLQFALLAFATLLVTACAAAGANSRPDSKPDLGSAAIGQNEPQGSSLAWPVDTYYLTYVQRQRVKAAIDLKSVSCMSAYGLELVRIPAAEKDIKDARRYGVMNGVDAANYGYHIPAAYTPAPLPVERITEEYVLAYSGLHRDGERLLDGTETVNGLPITPGGCRANALRELGIDARDIEMSHLAQGISQRSWANSFEDARVKSVIASWSACMSAAGFTASDPLKIVGATAKVSLGITEQEVRTAVADIQCKADVDLITIWHSVEADLQNAEINQNLDAFASIKAKNLLIVQRTDLALANN